MARRTSATSKPKSRKRNGVNGGAKNNRGATHTKRSILSKLKFW